MDWKQIGTFIADKAPLLGMLVGGPAGPAVGALIAATLGTGSSPDAVHAALVNNSDAIVKLQQLENDRQLRLQELVTDQAKTLILAEQGNMTDVNKTMQSEAASDHWPTYTWRPLLGMAVAFNTVAAGALVLIVFGPVMFGVQAAAAAVASLPTALGALAGINATVLPVLGIASWFRGKMQADPAIPTDNRG